MKDRFVLPGIGLVSVLVLVGVALPQLALIKEPSFKPNCKTRTCCGG